MKTTTIDGLYDAVIDRVKTLGVFRNVHDELNTSKPSGKECVVELESVDFSDGGQLYHGIDEVSVSFSILVFYPFVRGRKPVREVRELAVHVARLFSAAKIEGGDASPVQVMEDASFDELSSHVVWEVQIQIDNIKLGELPDEPEIPKGDALAAWVPHVGPDHIDSYESVESGTQI
ncbi:hypothetical protein KDW99_08920 [Marinomonas rhizomae]|uniref:hypothetical protein n=1 Tax=Marinomonas rhizomae TaxID=491948 RepID=UPI0021052A4A|nr:hypothetical protein [Marinomonas rhizomae]UTW01229.1 hypothetical protein KDW99_08920 [Marinomonas rhizomae]